MLMPTEGEFYRLSFVCVARHIRCMKTSTLAVPVAALALLSVVTACSGSDECGHMQTAKTSYDAIVDEPFSASTVGTGGYYAPLTFEGLPPGLARAADDSVKGTPTEPGTYTVTVHDAGNPKFDCAVTTNSFQIVVADKPVECASDNDCEIIDNDGATCTTSSDCTGSSQDATCAKLDVGGGRCKGDSDTTIICGQCTHDLELESVEGKGYHDCGIFVSGPTCSPRGHCLAGPNNCG